MRLIIYYFVLLQSLLFLGCQDPASSEPEQHIFKRYGFVHNDWSVWCPNNDVFEFSTLGDRLPPDFGCKEGDYVYFEAEEGYSNGNRNGGTTFWCKLIFMKIHQL